MEYLKNIGEGVAALLSPLGRCLANHHVIRPSANTRRVVFLNPRLSRAYVMAFTNSENVYLLK